MAYNQGDDRKETGQNTSVQLTLGTGSSASSSSIPVTNVTIDEEADTSETQTIAGNGQKDVAVTGVSYSGSFEIAGNAQDAHEEAYTENSKPSGSTSSFPDRVANMTISDQNRDYNFSTVAFTSTSKDMPADDRTTRSFDFIAEDLTVTPKP